MAGSECGALRLSDLRSACHFSFGKILSQRYLILDYETRSEVDLKVCGAYEYSLHPSTQILCAAWRVGTREDLRIGTVSCWSPAIRHSYSPSKDDLLHAMLEPGIIIVAHNAMFEQVITRNVLKVRMLPPKNWLCTAALAASYALPRKLEGACAALKLPVQKDMEGHRLMLKLSKPRKESKNNKAKWHKKMRDLKRVMQYCVTDIDAETELFLTLPELNPLERKIWELDQRINLRGFKADRELVTKVLRMIGEETKKLNEETRHLTNGEVWTTGLLEKVHGYLERRGVHLPDLSAKTVSDALKSGLVNGDAARLLQIRQSVSKTSTKKYRAFDMRSKSDGRVRDAFMYHAASTGRWGGKGLQPQNFPRGKIKDTETAVEILKTGDVELVRMIYGDPLDAFASCLRAVIIPTESRKFIDADFASIEVRVLFWLARHDAGLNLYIENRDAYREMATAIYSKELEDVTKDEREVGKRAVLGCGFGMGFKKFAATCKQFGMEVSEDLAKVAVGAYRTTHYPVPKLWGNIERAAIEAVQHKGKRYTINRTSWFVEGPFLYCKLPSGRRLAYYGPSVRYEDSPWGEKMPKLYHWGVHPHTKKWVESSTYGGRLTENCVQATARDLMSEGMLRIDNVKSCEIVLHAHDELLSEVVEGACSVKEFQDLMATLPKWATGLPVKAEGWLGDRYRK